MIKAASVAATCKSILLHEQHQQQQPKKVILWHRGIVQRRTILSRLQQHQAISVM